MVATLISLLIAVVVLGLVLWIFTLIPLPHPFGKIAQVLIALIALFWILHIFGLVPWR